MILANDASVTCRTARYEVHLASICHPALPVAVEGHTVWTKSLGLDDCPGWSFATPDCSWAAFDFNRQAGVNEKVSPTLPSQLTGN